MTKNSQSNRHPVQGIIVGHGNLPAALLEAAQLIVGPAGGIEVVSNASMSTDELTAKIDGILQATAAAATIIFVDMYGSSCAIASLRTQHNRSNVAVLCGVNLPMLVRFITHRDRDSFDELVRIVREAGGCPHT